MVGLRLSDRRPWASREGRTILVPLADRVLIGVMATADSPAASEGEDLVFAACSSRCEKILRKEVPRGLRRVEKLMPNS
jgi:hypothetical protein